MLGLLPLCAAPLASSEVSVLFGWSDIDPPSEVEWEEIDTTSDSWDRLAGRGR